MYKRIMGFFGGVTESSEENQELTEERNNESHHQSEEKNTILGTSAMAAGEEAAVLRNRVIQLEKELRDRIAENESYKNRLQLVEKELSILKNMAISDPPKRVSTGVGENDVKSDNVTTGTILNIDTLRNENTELKEALSKTSELLKDKSDLCENQEKQNEALTNQVSSLKEVVTITKDLLNIRNMEVRHLQSDVESMEGKISEEKKRHNTMIGKMDEAVKLNSDLKQEYGKQLRIFQDLKGKYEEKVAILMKENKKLEGQLQMSKVDAPLPPDEGSNDNASQ